MTHIQARGGSQLPQFVSLSTAAPLGGCSLVLGTRGFETADAEIVSSYVCWTGRSGKDYLLERCARKSIFHRDDRVVLLAKQSGFGGEVALWVGQASDLVNDPGERANFRAALNQMDHAYLITAPAEEDARHVLVWDLEKSTANLAAQVA